MLEAMTKPSFQPVRFPNLQQSGVSKTKAFINRKKDLIDY